MKFTLASSLIVFALFCYFSLSSKESDLEPLEHVEQTESVKLTENINHNRDLDSAASINVLASNAGANKPVLARQTIDTQASSEASELVESEHIAPTDNSMVVEEGYAGSSEFVTAEDAIEEPAEKLPGEEVNFRLKLHTSTHHMIDGKATSDIGDMLLKSRLMPSNEVKLSIKLKQTELDDVELTAYIDLANFTMELNGSNGVLNKDHKQVMKFALSHLKSKFEHQYQDYGFPEHALMLVQMIGYWSVSPEGYVHEKRSIISQ